MSRDRAIWHVPLLVLAGLTAIAGVLVGAATMVTTLPPAFGAPVQWGLAGASLTFTLARIIARKQVTRRELELLLLASAAFVAPYVLIGAGIIAGAAIVLLVIDNF
jgi:hypothetical protein